MSKYSKNIARHLLACNCVAVYCVELAFMTQRRMFERLIQTFTRRAFPTQIVAPIKAVILNRLRFGSDQFFYLATEQYFAPNNLWGY